MHDINIKNEFMNTSFVFFEVTIAEPYYLLFNFVTSIEIPQSF